MTIPTHHPAHLHPEKNRKKDFPSVAKLLDDLNFQDEAHPDFFIRSSRFKSKSNPLAHRSPFIEHSTSCLHSSHKAKPSLLLPRVNRLDQSIHPNHLPTPSSRPDPTIPLLLRSSSEPNSETPFLASSPTDSEISSPSSSATLNESHKRPYASEDDDDEHDSSDIDEALNSALDLRINWQSQRNQPKIDCDRVIARPSRTWLKRPADEPTASCLVEGNELMGLIVPTSSKSFEIHQADKRRRFIHSPRFHQGIRVEGSSSQRLAQISNFKLTA